MRLSMAREVTLPAGVIAHRSKFLFLGDSLRLVFQSHRGTTLKSPELSQHDKSLRQTAEVIHPVTLYRILSEELDP